jgi:hypothetical protein
MLHAQHFIYLQLTLSKDNKFQCLHSASVFRKRTVNSRLGFKRKKLSINGKRDRSRADGSSFRFLICLGLQDPHRPYSLAGFFFFVLSSPLMLNFMFDTIVMFWDSVEVL